VPLLAGCVTVDHVPTAFVNGETYLVSVVRGIAAG
jgi:hypothetical protein